MRRILEAAGQSAPESKPVLEVNVSHPLLKRIDETEGEAEFNDLCLLVYDQAKLAESGSVADPGEFVRRLNRLLVSVMP